MAEWREPVVCQSLCRFRFTKEGPTPQEWLQRSWLDTSTAEKVGWRPVTQMGPRGPEMVWACPNCALELGVVAKLSVGFRAALDVLARHEGVMSSVDFSETHWPDRSTFGRGWNLPVTYLMGRLAARGLIRPVFIPKTNKKGKKLATLRLQGYRITHAGQQALTNGCYDVPRARGKNDQAR